MKSTQLAPRRMVTAPLLRRESMGDVYHVLSFDDPDGAPVLPGQFCMLRGAEWGDAPLLPRPMSYLSGGTAPSVLIKVLGDGTRRMARAEPGESFSLLGPLGRPWRAPTQGRRQVLVAGGVGVAPLLFFARTLAEQGIRATSVYGGRTDRDLPLDDDLAELSDLHVTTEDGSRGSRGRVTDVLQSLLTHDVEVYTCGPDRMMSRVAELCARADVPCEVSLETPMACGYGVCLGCAVPTREGQYLYACVQGPCLNAREVDWQHAPAFGPLAKQRPQP